jgi:hypothetical protein
MNAIEEAALIRVRRSLGDLRGAVHGLPAEALNWQPARETNSIASQIAHVLKSSNFLLSSAHTRNSDLGQYLIERENAFHFRADEATLLQMLDEFDRSLPARLADIDEHTFAEVIDWRGGDWPPATVAWCLLGVVEHIREHVGAAALTRQLWESFGHTQDRQREQR